MLASTPSEQVEGYDVGTGKLLVGCDEHSDRPSRAGRVVDEGADRARFGRVGPGTGPTNIRADFLAARIFAAVMGNYLREPVLPGSAAQEVDVIAVAAWEAARRFIAAGQRRDPLTGAPLHDLSGLPADDGEPL